MGTIQEHVMPLIDERVDKQPDPSFHDQLLFLIIGNQILSLIVTQFFIYGTYLLHIDFDLVVISSFILARKLIYRKWLQITNYSPILTKQFEGKLNEDYAAMVKPKQEPVQVKSGKTKQVTESEDATKKNNFRIERIRKAILKKQVNLEMYRYAIGSLAVIFFLRVCFKYTFKKSLCLVYPILAQAALFGHHDFTDLYQEIVSWNQPS